MELTIFWLVLCVIIAAWASNIHRSAGGYFFLSLIASPLVGAMVLLIRGKGAPHDPRTGLPIMSATCPHCKETVRMDATLCKHCRSALGPQPG